MLSAFSLLLVFTLGLITIDAVSIQYQPKLISDTDAALSDAEMQLSNLQNLAQSHAHSRYRRRLRSKFPSKEMEQRKSIEESHEKAPEAEEPPIIVGSVLHNPEILHPQLAVTETPSAHHSPVIFASAKNNTESSKIYLDFESDFKSGYHIVEPPPKPLAEPAEDPWFKVITPEEEVQLEEGELKEQEMKIKEEEEKVRKEFAKDTTTDPKADHDPTTRDLRLITRLGRKSEKLMEQLEALSNLHGAESSPEVIAEAKKLLHLYHGIKKQIADAVMKYSSYRDFEGGFAPSYQILTFPMENPLPPKGQQEVVTHTIRNPKIQHFDSPPYKEDPLPPDGEAETVYTPLEHPHNPVIE